MEEESPWPSATDVRPCLAGATNYESSHEECWKQLTLKEAVTRGESLRAEKVCAPRTEKECKVIGLEYIKRPPLRKRHSQNCRYTSSNHKHKNVRPKNTQKSLGTFDFTTCKRYKKPLTCSIRIEELAVPSKRQCLDTWRENYKILPEVMINRLREYILDQRVTVNVDKAIRCFRNKKRKRKHPSNHSTTSSNCQRKSVKDMDKIKCISQILARKLCQELIVPIKIKLNPEQQRLSQIVARDIKELMRSRRKQCQYCNLGCRKILREVSNTVTVWVATILDESSNRLLEEALRDLEEEEGPVLDILDNIVDDIGKSEDDLIVPTELIADKDDKYQGEDRDVIEPGLDDSDQIAKETGYFHVENNTGSALEVQEKYAKEKVEKNVDDTLLEADAIKFIDKLEDSYDRETLENYEEIKESNKLESQKSIDGDELKKSGDDIYREISAASEGNQDESGDMVQESDVTGIVNEEHYEKSEEVVPEDRQNYGDLVANEPHTSELLDENKSNNAQASERLLRGGKIDVYDQDTFRDEKTSENYYSPELPMEVHLGTSVDLKGSEDSPSAEIERKNEQKDIVQINNTLTILPSNLTVDEPREETEDTGTKEDVMDEGNPRGGPLENEEFLDTDEMAPEKEEQRKVTFGASGTDLQIGSKIRHNLKVSKDKLNPPNNNILSSVDESWPEDLVLRLNPLHAVSKSVTSLGNIKEVSDQVQQTKVGSVEETLVDTREEYVDALEFDKLKHNIVSSQIDQVTKDQAQETKLQLKAPPPIIPFNKSTETEDTETESGNRSEQTTDEAKYKTPPIVEEVEPILQGVMAVNYDEAEMKPKENLVSDTLPRTTEKRKSIAQTSSAFVEITKKEPDPVTRSQLSDIQNQESENKTMTEIDIATTIIKADIGQIDKDNGVEAKTNEARPIKSEETLNIKKEPSVAEKQKQANVIKDQARQIKSDRNFTSNFIAQEEQNKRNSNSSFGFSDVPFDGVVESMPPTHNIDDIVVKTSQETPESEPMALGSATIVTNESQVTNKEILKGTDKLSDGEEVNTVANKDKNFAMGLTVINIAEKPKLQSVVQEVYGRIQSNKNKVNEEQTEKSRDEAFLKQNTKYKTTPTAKTTVGKKPANKSHIDSPNTTSKEESHKTAKKPDIKSKSNAPTKTTYKSAVKAKPIKTKSKKVNAPPKPQLVVSTAAHEVNAKEVIAVIKTPLEPTFDFKVCLETAPSWVLNQEKGEPSEDSLLGQIKERQKLQERKLREWCRDLEVAAINLEKWTQWIDDATANIMYLKRHKKDTRKASQIQNKKWRELKTCIDKDTILWSKLYQRATRKFDKYRSILKDTVNPLDHKKVCRCRR